MKSTPSSQSRTASVRASLRKRTSLPVMVVAISAALLGSARPAVATAQESTSRITKGPCLLRVGQDRAALMWETDIPGAAGVDDGRLLQRILDDATTAGAPWKFLSYHVPSVNFGGHRSDWQRRQAVPGFARAGIDFVITGHSHLYERFRPVVPPGQGSSVTYITSGGGGAPLHEIKPTARHACARSTHQFCLFHIKGDVLTMDAIDMEGRVFDHLAIAKKAGRLDDAYLSTAVPMADILRR
jgi:hypothetical protein